MAKASEHIDQVRKMAERAGHRDGAYAALAVTWIRRTYQSIAPLDEYTKRSLHSYFLVTLVTHVEVFFRSTLAMLIDHGSPYIDRVDGLAKDLKFDLNSIRALQGREITIGEVLSLVPSFQNLEAICSVMSVVIGTPFLPAIAQMHDRWDTEVLEKSKVPIIHDGDDLAKNLARLFEARHVAVHEIPRSLGITDQDVSDFIDATEQFLSASRWYVEELIDPGAPLQQQPMNARAGQKAHEADRELKVEYNKLLGVTDEDRKADLEAAQNAWLKFREATSEFEANEYRGGSLSPLIRWTTFKTLTDERILALKRMIFNIETDPRRN